MQCPRCKVEIPNESKYCNICGRKLIKEKHIRARGNGDGCVYQLPNKKWRAVRTLGYELDEKGHKHRITKSKSGFATKKEALAYLPTLQGEKLKGKKRITFKGLYGKWEPTHGKSKSTMNCYAAAMNYFKPIWYCQVDDIDIDDLQECIDECPKGRRTQENMKALAGLLYKFGTPRNYIPGNLNLGTFIRVGGSITAHKSSFTETQIELIRKGLGKILYADYIYCLIYTGFRPSEFLKLDSRNYNRKEKAFVGGSKTEAGTDRTVTVSPKIQPIIDRLTTDKISGPVFCDDKGKEIPLKDFRENYFYPALEALGIENPITVVDGNNTHKYTPHSCRHTFATLIKKVEAPDKDKLELIGHTSEEMLRYYQDVNYEDLRKITNAL